MSLIEEGFSLPLIIFSWGWFRLFYFYPNGYCLLVCQHRNLFSAAFVFGEKRGKPFSFLCHEHIHSPPPFSLFVSQQHDFTMPSCQKKLLLPWRHALDQERRAGRVCDNGFVWDFIVTWGQFSPVFLPWEYCFISFTLLWTPDSSRSLKNSAEMKIYYLAG